MKRVLWLILLAGLLLGTSPYEMPMEPNDNPVPIGEPPSFPEVPDSTGSQ